MSDPVTIAYVTSQIASGLAGLYNSYKKSSTPVETEKYSRYSAPTSTLSNTASKNVFKLVDRYKDGSDSYKDFLNKNRYGEATRLTNADFQDKTSDQLSNTYGNASYTNTNLNGRVLRSYLDNRNTEYYGTAEKEAKLNMANVASLKTTRFNDLRFLDSVNEANKQKKDFTSTLNLLFRSNDDDILNSKNKG
jgi:hypothetical protein